MSSERSQLLVVEDDLGIQGQMKWALDEYNIVFAADRQEALAQVRRHEPAVVTLDLGLPPVSSSSSEGFGALRDILSFAPMTKVIVVTGQSDRHNAVEAVAQGAYDFIAKPYDPDLLGLVIGRAFRLAELEQEKRRLSQQLSGNEWAGLITRDPTMLKTCRQVEKLAAFNATVMLLGESGTGKELLARALHEQSPRKSRNFVAINCAAIPENLLESELFGYERGAFTGATKQTIGKIEVAQGGTLFLDEIGDLPLALQAKLLRFLQERVIERVGGRAEIPVDVRVVCATHQNLRQRIADGGFREDLYYRLGEMLIAIPPLRDRVGDAVLLAHALVARFAAEMGRKKLVLGDDAVQAIERHAWPGNVRELANTVKRAIVMSEGVTIGADDLGLSNGIEQQPPTLKQVREDAERQAILKAMARVNGSVALASELLGVSRPTLYDLLERYGLR